MFTTTTFIIIALIAAIYYIRKLIKIPKELENVPTASGLPLAWALFRRKHHDEIQNTIRKSLKDGHGIHLSRAGASIYINITSPEYVKNLLMVSEDIAPKLQFRPGNSIYEVFGNGMLFSNGDTWRTHRGLANLAFNKALSPETVGETVFDLFSFIQKKINQPIDVFDVMQRTTIEILGKLAFGHRFLCLESEEPPQIINIYKFIIETAESIIRFTFPWIDYLPTEHNKKFSKFVKEFNEFIFNLIELKRKEIKFYDRKDLLSTMLKLSEEEGIRTNEKQLRDEIVTFFVAGHDTTSMALSASLYHLAKNPEIQERARAEAISILGNKPIIPTSDQLKEMKYINALVKETLRMYPPVSGISLRNLTKPIKIGPYVIPKNVLCTLNIWQIHHDPSYWENPEQYNPERFLSNEKRHPFSWIPFSGGPRSCVGQNFALMEQKVTLSMMLLKYNLTLPENSVNKEKLLLESQFLLTPVDLKLVFTERV